VHSEALDAGIVPFISRILNSAQDFSPAKKDYTDTRTKVAACHYVSVMFGIGRGDERNIGFVRIFEAMGNRHVSVMFGIGRGDERNIGFARIFEAMGNRHRIISQILGSILYF
jgi:hypothetical protein